MESQRQKKVSSLLLKDLSNIVQGFFREKTRVNFLISITKVKVSVDLSTAKIFISVFPSSNSEKACEILKKNLFEIKKRLSFLVKIFGKSKTKKGFFSSFEGSFKYRTRVFS